MEIAEKIQAILQDIDDDELPSSGEINFIIHIDGAEDWSWANIRNGSEASLEVPDALVKNLTK